MDVAFHIAFKLDSIDRYLNLIKLINYLSFIFPRAKIRLCEQDVNRKLFLREPNVDYFFLRSPNFSKNECYNLLALRSTESIIIHNDCDYLINKSSFLEAINKTKEHPIVLVHNGSVENINRDAFDILGQESFTGEFLYKDYYGGILAYQGNFIRKYKENPNLKGWGFDSLERYERIYQLGFYIERGKDKAYHMDHERTPGSSKRNPHYPSNGLEYQRIMNMSREDLTNYILKLEVKQF